MLASASTKALEIPLSRDESMEGLVVQSQFPCHLTDRTMRISKLRNPTEAFGVLAFQFGLANRRLAIGGVVLG